MRGGDVAADASLRALALVVAEGVMGVRDGCIEWANERLAEIAGRGGTSLAGLKVSDLLRDVEDGLPRPRGPAALESAVLRTDGQLRSVLCRRVADDSRDGLDVWVLEDVTHVRDLERELLRAAQELSLANRELESAKDHLGKERREREELLSVVSHELRTPLTVVGGYTRLLLTGDVGPLNEEQQRFLEESQRSCKRLAAFVSNILEASSVTRGGEVLEIGNGPLAPVIESIASMFRPLLAERRLALELDIDGELTARFDPLRVEQVLTNLLGNAVKYAPPGGSVSIALRPHDNGSGRSHFVEISVADDGPGVAPEDRARICEPYVQAGSEPRADGLGLGLSICRRLVEAHGGWIGLTDRPGGGACFAFTLPIGDPPHTERT